MTRRSLFRCLAALAVAPWVGRKKAEPAPFTAADAQKMYAVMKAHQESYLRVHAQALHFTPIELEYKSVPCLVKPSEAFMA